MKNLTLCRLIDIHTVGNGRPKPIGLFLQLDSHTRNSKQRMSTVGNNEQM